MSGMKLGRDTGSLINHVMSLTAAPLPKVGDGATILGWTDRYPATVISVSEKEIRVQEDFAYRTDKNGMSECQEYEYIPNPDGAITVVKRVGRGKAKGEWRVNGLTGSNSVVFGYREKYYDFSF